jgi:hypothetical protein
MDESEYEEIYTRYMLIKIKDTKRDASHLWLNALAENNDADIEKKILQVLVSEYQFIENDKLAEDSIGDLIKLDPDDPWSWCVYAEHCLYFKKDFIRALSIINTATSKAMVSGNFVRYSCAVKIRIALELKQFKLVEDTMEFLLAYYPQQGSIDNVLENDFIGRIPSGAVDRSIIDKYIDKNKLERNK